jgi:hypothetical protein
MRGLIFRPSDGGPGFRFCFSKRIHEPARRGAARTARPRRIFPASAQVPWLKEALKNSETDFLTEGNEENEGHKYSNTPA